MILTRLFTTTTVCCGNNANQSHVQRISALASKIGPGILVARNGTQINYRKTITTNIWARVFQNEGPKCAITRRSTLTEPIANYPRQSCCQTQPPCGARHYSTAPRIQRIPELLRWSYVSVGGNTPLLGLTIGQVIDRAADLFGDREAVVSLHQGLRKTFTDLQKDSTAIAAGLLATGLSAGDRLGIWSPNNYQWIVTQFGAAKAGLVLVNINPGYLANDLLYCLNKVSIKGIVCAKGFKNLNYHDLLCEAAPELRSSPAGRLASLTAPHLRTVITMVEEEAIPGTISFQDLPSLATSENRTMVDSLVAEVQFDDPCNIQFTSGTTGSPKAAVLSHHNVVNNANNMGRRLHYDKKPHRISLSVPLFHCFGCVAGSLAGALHGATCVLPSEGFSAEASHRAIMNEGITSVYGTPTMFIDILSAARANNAEPPASPLTGVIGGAPCPSELVQALNKNLNAKDLLVTYGMTETSPGSFQCFREDSTETRVTTVGFPFDHTEVKITDRRGKVVPVGEEGELCVRGYSVFQGYWDDKEKTDQILGADRWLKTGDLAILDKYGYARISGRVKDVVIRGGENLYPAELENFFLGHPAVKEAQVIGVPDHRLGEEMAVLLRLVDGHTVTQKEFRDWCKGKIAAFKIPRYVLIKTVFPVTATGKIQKFKMREETIKELNLT